VFQFTKSKKKKRKQTKRNDSIKNKNLRKKRSKRILNEISLGFVLLLGCNFLDLLGCGDFRQFFVG